MSNEELQNRIEVLETQMREHTHNGILGGSILLKEIFGVIKTVTVAGDLTNLLASVPVKLSDQVFIDTTTTVKKLYIYDSIGNAWRDIPISGLTGTNTFYVSLTSGGAVTHLLTFVDGLLIS